MASAASAQLHPGAVAAARAAADGGVASPGASDEASKAGEQEPEFPLDEEPAVPKVSVGELLGDGRREGGRVVELLGDGCELWVGEGRFFWSGRLNGLT